MRARSTGPVRFQGDAFISRLLHRFAKVCWCQMGQSRAWPLRPTSTPQNRSSNIFDCEQQPRTNRTGDAWGDKECG
jgi:hypothetical protein